MNAFNDLKMSTKLISAFILMAVISIVVGVFGIYYIRTIDAADTNLYQNYTVPISQLERMGTAFQRIRVNLRDSIFHKDEAANENYETVAQLRSEMDSIADEYEALIETQEMREMFKRYQEAVKAFDPYIDQIIALDKAGKSDEATALLLGDAKAKAKELQDSIEGMVILKVDQAQKIADGNTSAANQANTIMIAIIVVGVLLAVGLGLVISRSISVPLGIAVSVTKMLSVGDMQRNMEDKEKDKVRKRKDEIGDIGKSVDALIDYMQEMGHAAQMIAQNDLTVSVKPRGEKDELGNAFASMIASLRDSVGKVAENARNLNAASAQLATASNQAGQATNQISVTIQQVASGTQQQTSAITKTAHSVEEMTRAINGVARGAQEQAEAVSQASTLTAQLTKAIQQVAGNAQAVSNDAGKAAQAAQRGAETVADTIRGMEGIREKVGVSAQRVQDMGARSEEIGAIVITIEDIAAQTNLLALNAAIEAARAGEHGKGFAVVADEVRKLAERAANATKEIGVLVKDIQKTVNEAVKAMEEGSREVDSGVGKANMAGSVLTEIAEAAASVLQQSEQAAAAAEEMSAAADELVASVDTVSAVVEENTASTEQMSASSSEVTSAIENVASISEENSAAAEEVSAATEEMSAQVEEVSASATSLADMAGRLQSVVAQFKL